MDEIMKGVKIGKLLGKDEKKETCKVIAIVVGVIAVSYTHLTLPTKA